MIPENLISDLHKLSRTDKLKVMQLLIDDLELEAEHGLVPGTQYEVWSPQITAEGACILLEVHNEPQRRATTDNHE